MNPERSSLLRMASFLPLWPILGLMGGLVLGAFRAKLLKLDELSTVATWIRFGLVGFFLGLAMILLLTFGRRREDLGSVRRLMVLVAIAALILAFVTQLLLLGLIAA